MITKIFDLGKKPYSYVIDENTNAVLLGKSEWSEGSFCKLSFMFAIVNSNEQVLSEELDLRSSIIGEYTNRSSKFNSGNFTNFDAQRYIKSRYRDIIRHLNRQRNGEDRIRILREYSNEFIQRNNHGNSVVTSAEIANFTN